MAWGGACPSLSGSGTEAEFDQGQPVQGKLPHTFREVWEFCAGLYLIRSHSVHITVGQQQRQTQRGRHKWLPRQRQ